MYLHTLIRFNIYHKLVPRRSSGLRSPFCILVWHHVINWLLSNLLHNSWTPSRGRLIHTLPLASHETYTDRTQLNNNLATLPRDVDGQPQNCLVLCLSPDQRTFNHGITPTAETLDSYFVDWDILDLANFCNQRIAYIPYTSPDDRIDCTTFLIIDDRTLQDGSVRVVSREVETINEDVFCEMSRCPWDNKDVLEMVRCGLKDLGVLLPCIEEDGLRGTKIDLGDDDVWEF